MLTILFKILGILGILLLVLLGIALTVILLVLFFPLCYKASGQKRVDEMNLWIFCREPIWKSLKTYKYNK